ncbi:MAG: class I SAM-dependent methyltransferase [Terracidiphilus sp.]|nr:class I SAM-dependent methyltransferase [Terracidiphilus sp.]
MSFKDAEIVDLNRGYLDNIWDDFTSERYAQFVKHFPSHTRDVLDIGCNAGRGGQIVKSMMPSAQIVGLDCVSERLQQLDPSVYRSTICGFADNIDSPSNSFDAIVAGEIIEHIPGVSVFPALCEMFRVLRLRGRLLLTSPNPHYLYNRLKGRSIFTEPAHISQHTCAGIRRKLEDAGFSNIRICGSGRVTRYLGQHFPIISAYGSYLAVADKW